MSIVTSAAVIYALLCVLLYFAQRSMMYFPTPASSLPGAQALEVASGGETLRIWTRPVAGAPALVYFGGNAEDVAGNFAPLANALPGHALYLVNYRGYGGSSGSPTEAGLFADALALYDRLAARNPQVHVVGNSLGTGVAVYLARERPVSRLVLVAPYDSIAKVAQGHYPIFPATLLIKDRFDSASRVPGVKAPVLAILAERDEVIPRARSDALIAKFPAAQIRVEVIRGATHNTIAESPRYLELVGEFLR